MGILLLLALHFLGFGSSTNGGRTEIYVRSGSTWKHQATLTQNVDSSEEGCSVSLSTDGNTLAAGAQNAYHGTGVTLVYVRSNSTWKRQAFLTQFRANSHEGSAIKLSTDGNALVVGAPGFNNNTGIIYIYTRSQAQWEYQDSLTQGLTNSTEGAAIALSPQTLAVGAPYFNNTIGATFIYVNKRSQKKMDYIGVT